MASQVTRNLLETAAANYQRVMADLLPNWDWPCPCSNPGTQLRCLECPGFRLLVEQMQAQLCDSPQETFAQLPPIKRQKPYSEETRQNCIWLYEHGYTLTKIQELTGVANRKILRAWFVAENLMDISVQAHDSKRLKCLELYSEGLKPAQVEDATGVPADLITHWATQAGITRPNPTFTEAQKQECLELYFSGLSAKSIEQQTGVPELHVKKWIKESGVRRERISGGGRPPEYGEDDKQKALAMYREGYLTQQIEESTGIGSNTLVRWLKSYCLQLLETGCEPNQIEMEFGVGRRVLKQWWIKTLQSKSFHG